MGATYVGIRGGEVVYLRRCDDCGEEKVASDGRDSEFYCRRLCRKGRVSLAWDRFCKECKRRRKREAYAADPERARAAARSAWARLKRDPERRAMIRQRRNEWQRRRLREDPAYAERGREAHRRWMARKLAEDPDYFSRENRERRRRARANLGAAPPPPSDYGGRLEAGPFVSWLIAYREAIGAESAEELARDLGLVPRRVTSLLNGEQDHVSFDLVDHALQHARFPVELNGEVVVRIDDLYELDGAEVAA